MTRITVFLLTLMVAICFMIGCGLSDPIGVSVGSYKGNEPDYYQRQYIKDMGHKGHDTRNPTADEVRQYCSVCHYVN